MSLLSQAKMHPDLATLMAAQSYSSGTSAADLSMLFLPQFEQQGNKNADLATLNASMDMLGNLFSSGGANKNADLNALLFPQGGKQSSADLASIFAAAGQGLPPSSQPYSSKSGSSIPNPYYSQSTAAMDKAQQDLIALYGGNPMATGSGKYSSLQDPHSKSALANANNMFMNPSIYAKLQQDALNAMMMKPPKTSSKSESKSRETSASPASRNYNRETSASPASRSYNNFSAVDLAVSAVNQSQSSSSNSSHKKQFSISDLVSPSPSKMMKFAENFSSHDLSKSAHGDNILNLSGNGSDK